MPIYGYDCNKCGYEFETLVRSSETPSCPSCESTDLKRHLSLIAAPFKSGGDAPVRDVCRRLRHVFPRHLRLNG